MALMGSCLVTRSAYDLRVTKLKFVALLSKLVTHLVIETLCLILCFWIIFSLVLCVLILLSNYLWENNWYCKIPNSHKIHVFLLCFQCATDCIKHRVYGNRCLLFGASFAGTTSTEITTVASTTIEVETPPPPGEKHIITLVRKINKRMSPYVLRKASECMWKKLKIKAFEQWAETLMLG